MLPSFRSIELCRSAAAVTVLATMAACVSYREQPIDPRVTAAQLQARNLDESAVQEDISKLIPGRESNDSRWGMAELLIAAMRINPRLAEARAQLRAVSAGLKAAKELPNPAASLGGEYDLSRAMESPWLWSVSVQFALDPLLTRSLRVLAAEAAIRVGQSDYIEAAWSVRRELRAAYIAASVEERRLSVLQSSVELREQLVQLLDARVRVGETPSTERTQATLELSRNRIALADAGGALDAARAQLASAIGVPLSAIENRRLVAPVEPAAIDDARIDGLREQALLSRADLAHAIAEYQIRELDLHRAIRGQYPQVSLGPGFTWDHGVRKATLGIGVSLPVFNRNGGAIAQATADREAAGEHLLAVQAAILNEIDAAKLGYARMLDNWRSAQRQSAAARALAEQTAREVALGASDRVATIASRLAVDAERLAELDAYDRVQQALGRLEDALRTPLLGDETRIEFAPQK